MEKLCRIRDINRSIIEFETAFHKKYDLCLNEGMLMCTLRKTGKCSSGEIAEKLGLTTSNASKIICSVEKKGYIERVLGSTDKRQMYFTLTKNGEQQLKTIECDKLEIPSTLREIVEH